MTDNDKDALWLFSYFVASMPCDETLEYTKARIGMMFMRQLAEKHHHTRAAAELQQVTHTLNDQGTPLPIELRGFYPENHLKRKQGRSPFDKSQEYEDIARKIYDFRKKQGIFPDFDFEIWEVIDYLPDIINKQINADRGISNQLEAILNEIGINVYRYSASSVKQFYLGEGKRNLYGYRRLFILEDLARYCLDYWQSVYEWKLYVRHKSA